MTAVTAAAGRTVIVGASLAGLRVAEGLRAHGYPGEVLLLGDEPHAPYDRPPLSKQVLLGDWEPEKAYFRGADELAAQGIQLSCGTPAVGLQAASDGGAVVLADGTTVDYDRLVVATGARARLLPGRRLAGVQSLRTIDDVVELLRALHAEPRVTVIGGGFIGAEVASACRHLGLSTTLVEALPAPLSRVLGQQVGEACGSLYERNGVRMHTAAAVREISGTDRVEEVVLADGTRIPSDLVLVGIGAVPNCEWLAESGLVLEDGVVCDASGRAADNVWAVGDVARWHHPLFGQHIRVEHWTHATKQADHVARVLAGQDPGELVSVPYAWSDQFGVKIQVTGRPSAEHLHVGVSGELDTDRYLGLYVDPLGIVVGAVAFNNPRASAQTRRLIAARATLAEAASELATPGLAVSGAESS